MLRRALADRAEKKGIPLVLLEIFVVLTTPFLLPYFACVCVSCIFNLLQRMQLLKGVSRTYRPYEFLQVDCLCVDESIRELFERHTPALLQLGFTYLGDYRLKPEPVEVHDRLLLNADGEIVGTICAVLNGGAMSMISVLEDGTCVHTTTAADPHPGRTLEPADRLQVSYVPGISEEDLQFHHRNILAECSAANETNVMCFHKEQFREVLIYDQLIFCRWRYRHGGLDHEPPTPDFSSLAGRQPVLAEGSEHV
jgi:hypothetical protein